MRGDDYFVDANKAICVQRDALIFSHFFRNLSQFTSKNEIRRRLGEMLLVRNNNNPRRYTWLYKLPSSLAIIEGS
jgi:hypothetical protein